MDHEEHLQKKFASMNCQREKVEESSISASEEAAEVQHLLAEPKTESVSVDGVLCLGKENSWKFSGIEDFSLTFGYGPKRNCGGLDSNYAQGPDEMELGVLDGLLDDVDEVDDLHATDDISGACEDFLLDIELAEKVSYLDCTPFGQPNLVNSSSESQSPGFSGSSNGVPGLTESSTATIPEAECRNASLDKEDTYKLHDSSGIRCKHESPEHVGLHNSQDLEYLDDLKPLVCGMSSDENEKEVIQAIHGGAVLRQKRMRKPTKRYIEEYFSSNSKDAMEMPKCPLAISKDKRQKIRSSVEPHHVEGLSCSSKEFSPSEAGIEGTSEDDEKLSDFVSKCKRSSSAIERRKGSLVISSDQHLKVKSRIDFHHVRASRSAHSEESLITDIQTPPGARPRRRRPKKYDTLALSSGDELTASESEDNLIKRRSKKGDDRRKHQRMWTLSEVTNLIDGIAQCGTGRWTDIKNLLFSSSAYRTPVDLRDKWRNLLKASCAQNQKQKQNKKEVEQKLKHGMCPLPKSVIQRIRELASIHPYPRFTPGGRYVRRKN
ncbi:hypothetical protein K2173_019555 [Erythroxylum novogranatense]|uniref:Uncharacterized protein n=1 Tax=Erythroxylum novogranatense TaxID=1862640 RepID=A0AAV8UEX9_9ROSI|nr:hypothetical protein K2173_019555 [Erythroxylum novogranatense]